MTENFEDENVSTLPEREEKKVVVYDADAQQRFSFVVDGDDETTHIFNPISDERYFEFDQNSRIKLIDDGESIITDNSAALVNLFDDAIVDVEGIEGEKPADWKAEIDADKEKIPSISAYLAVAAFSNNKRSWGQTDSTVLTEAYFNNKTAQQTHFLRKKTVDDVRDFRRFQKIPLATKRKGLKSSELSMPSNGERKAELYDRMQTKPAEGYVGRVPAWHKIAVIDFLFSSSLTQKK